MTAAALLLLLATAVRAGGPGTSAVPLLSFDWGARPAAMGGAFVAAADDVHASLWNPGGLAFVHQPVVSAMHASLYQNISFDQLAAAAPLRHYGGLGGHFAYMNTGPIDRTTEDPSGSFNATGPGGTFRGSELKLDLSGAGRPLSWLGVGGAVNYFRDTVDKNGADAFTVDMGALARGRVMSYGLSLQNVGPQVRGLDAMPTTMRLGAAARLDESILLSFEYDYHFNSLASLYAIGAEYSFGSAFALRAGLQRPSGAGAPGVRWTMGFGSGLGPFSFDYSFAPYGQLGSVNQVVLSYTFGQKRGRPPRAKAEPPPTKHPEAEVGPDEHFLRADVMIEAKNYTKAKEELAAAMQVLAAEDRRRIHYFARMGNIALSANDVDAAQAFYADGLKLGASLGLSDPDVAEVYAGMGQCLAAKGSVPMGIRFLEKALEFGPSPKTKDAVAAKLKELKARAK